MTSEAIYRKTTAGEEEVVKRLLNLPLKMRSLLIAVDGKKSGEELKRVFAAFGDVPTMLSQLEEKSCIERIASAAAFKEPKPQPSMKINLDAKEYATSYIYGILGPESDSLMRRIEKCGNNDDLAKIFAECRELLAAIGKPKKAEEFWSRGQELLSQ